MCIRDRYQRRVHGETDRAKGFDVSSRIDDRRLSATTTLTVSTGRGRRLTFLKGNDSPAKIHPVQTADPESPAKSLSAHMRSGSIDSVQTPLHDVSATTSMKSPFDSSPSSQRNSEGNSPDKQKKSPIVMKIKAFFGKLEDGFMKIVMTEHTFFGLFLGYNILQTRTIRLIQYYCIIFGMFMTSSAFFDAKLKNQDPSLDNKLGTWEYIVARVKQVDQKDILLIILNMVLTAPITLVLNFLFKAEDIYGMELTRRKLRESWSRTTTRRFVGTIFALLYICFCSYMILIFAVTRQRQGEVVSWLVTFAMGAISNTLVGETLAIICRITGTFTVYRILQRCGFIKTPQSQRIRAPFQKHQHLMWIC
eukprot:TRINITY_DN9135_c0_g1_i2.p1 TRINITY_DN9135_c0_g1~~TRINITY_DN9135_c0_g1_i2.p1  ORF type:complete len:364 (-),score=45.13 TRINITY_DN9135_c0_g1_i2:162-1253(-)